jgi:hypothetical protein
MLKGRQARFVLFSVGCWSLARLGVHLASRIMPFFGLGLGLVAGGVMVGLNLYWPRPVPGAIFVPARAGMRSRVHAAAPLPPVMTGRFEPIADWEPADRAPQLLRFAVRQVYAGSAQAALRYATFAAPLPHRDAAPSPPPVPPAPAATSRWGASAYLFVRQGSGRPGLAANGQLGGSQAAARITYRLNRDGPVRTAIAARLYAPLDGKGAEAALGLDWYPLPGKTWRLSVERRVALDAAGRDAWSAYAAGGFYSEPKRGVVVDGYAQTGLVGLHARDAFVDGALRAGARIGPATIGAGLWGAAQPGVSRLDIGPRLALATTAGKGVVSLAVEGRFRLAGRANPGSGATLTLAADF